MIIEIFDCCIHSNEVGMQEGFEREAKAAQPVPRPAASVCAVYDAPMPPAPRCVALLLARGSAPPRFVGPLCAMREWPEAQLSGDCRHCAVKPVHARTRLA